MSATLPKIRQGAGGESTVRSASRDGFERLVSARPALAAGYVAARRHASRHLAASELDIWSATSAALYHANAGPGVLGALWNLEKRALPGASLATLVTVAEAAREVCCHAGSGDAAAALVSAEARLVYGGDGREAAVYIAILAALAKRAPDGVAPVVASSGRLLAALGPDGLSGWIEDGLSLYPRDRRRRAAYFRLEDPVARRRLIVHGGASRFAVHEERLKILTRALFAYDLDVQQVPVEGDTGGLARTRLAGPLLLMPEAFRGLPEGRAEAFFESAVLHAAAHRRFTRERFSAGKLKPMQIALTAVIEDARVERLAATEFPGLARLWRSFHTVEASRAETVVSLFARLSRALADPGFEDGDGWIMKGRAMFEAAYAENPERQNLSRDLANILGHELGQLRIPFDGKSYRVEPAYRDDGLGLFDLTEADPDTLEQLDVILDGARLREEEQDGSDGEPPPDSTECERSRMVDAAPDERGPVLGVYPEWDSALGTELPDHVTVRDYAPAIAASTAWLDGKILENAGLSERIGAMVRRARLDRPVRVRRQIDGEDIDIEAAQEAMIARRIGETPDARIHSVKRRRGRDVALSALLDTSASTGDIANAGSGARGETVLASAALSVALLAEALAGLPDPFAVLAFASNGRDDVRMTTIKAFSDSGEATVPRLAGLSAGYSTRLGAAIRHASEGLRHQRSHRKVLIVVTDGEPSDVDVEDADTLIADAKRAVASARAKGLDIFCVAIGERADAASTAIFGRRNTLFVARIADLSQRLSVLYFRLTVS